MGALIGKIYGLAVAAWLPAIAPDATVCALAGMATLGVTIVGGPLTMSFIVLENTTDYSVTAGVVAASVAASLLVRAAFGYSFSTWRLHLRGENIRSANDIGWIHDLKVGKLMRRDPPTALEFARHRGVLRQPSPGLGAFRGLARLRTGVMPDWSISPKPMRKPAASRDRSGNWRSKECLAGPRDERQVGDGVVRPDRNRPARGARPDTKAPLGVLDEAYLARRYAEQAAAAFHSAFGDWDSYRRADGRREKLRTAATCPRRYRSGWWIGWRGRAIPGSSANRRRG